MLGNQDQRGWVSLAPDPSYRSLPPVRKCPITPGACEGVLPPSCLLRPHNLSSLSPTFRSDNPRLPGYHGWAFPERQRSQPPLIRRREGGCGPIGVLKMGEKSYEREPMVLGPR